MTVSKNRALAILAALLLLAGCSSTGKTEAKYPTGASRTAQASQNDIYSPAPSIFGKGGMHLFGKDKGDDSAGTTGIGVNSFLWRASLDTVAFMPLASADPFGGVILTDWYSSPGSPDERVKLNVFILDRQLRSDGVQVKVFRQVRNKKGKDWSDAAVTDDVGRKIEDAILTRARQMRVSQIGSGN